jgi:hypothetical protein
MVGCHFETPQAHQNAFPTSSVLLHFLVSCTIPTAPTINYNCVSHTHTFNNWGTPPCRGKPPWSDVAQANKVFPCKWGKCPASLNGLPSELERLMPVGLLLDFKGPQTHPKEFSLNFETEQCHSLSCHQVRKSLSMVGTLTPHSNLSPFHSLSGPLPHSFGFSLFSVSKTADLLQT